MREKRQHNTNFNDWYTFELLPQHLEHEALQTYEQWSEAHWMELRQVKRYWEPRVELVSTLKEGATSSLMAISEVKLEVPEEVYVMDVEGASGEPKNKGFAPVAASTSSPIFPLSRYVQATQAALASLGLRQFLSRCGNSSCIHRKSTEVSVGIKCSGYMILDRRRTIHLGGLLGNLEVCSRKVS